MVSTPILISVVVTHNPMVTADYPDADYSLHTPNDPLNADYAEPYVVPVTANTAVDVLRTPVKPEEEISERAADQTSGRLAYTENADKKEEED